MKTQNCTSEQVMLKFANKHSYNTWDELVNDCHAHTIIEYTKKVMQIYARQFKAKSNLKLIKEYLFNTAEIGKNIDENYLKQTVKFLNELK